MSAPTPAPGDDRPREGYYPDPSIPGYVRYWNGAAWVPGTSRPAPSDGRPLTPPAGSGGPAPAVEETGPHFFDEDPEPASAWAADAARQSGFGGDQDRRISWGSPQPADPRAPRDPRVSGQSSGTSTPAGPPADHESGSAGDHGTVTFRAPVPRTGEQRGSTGSAGGTTPGTATAPAAAKPGFGAGKAAAARAAAQGASAGTTGTTGGTTTSRPGGVAPGTPGTPHTSGGPGAQGAPAFPASPSTPGTPSTPTPRRPPGIS
ncbi:DUF2510 domain-containing protein, partial [Streptomyces acidiscabies]|uniref:DUF2510 domain-containing protein n=1 Tax=Streptomyces acidiscabies TaxID=42234 RepID=UPI00118026FB